MISLLVTPLLYVENERMRETNRPKVNYKQFFKPVFNRFSG